MKRKTIATIAAAILALAMTACGNTADTPMVDESAIETRAVAMATEPVVTNVETTEEGATESIKESAATEETTVEDTEEATEEATEESMEEDTEETVEAVEEGAEEKTWWMEKYYWTGLDEAPFEPDDGDYADLIYIVSGKTYDDPEEQYRTKESDVIYELWCDISDEPGTNTLRNWLKVWDTVLKKYNVKDESLYANVPDADAAGEASTGKTTTVASNTATAATAKTDTKAATASSDGAATGSDACVLDSGAMVDLTSTLVASTDAMSAAQSDASVDAVSNSNADNGNTNNGNNSNQAAQDTQATQEK